MAVVIQRMINSKESGIAFDVSQYGEDLYAFSVNYGLGESIVGGMVRPEVWEIDPRKHEIFTCSIGDKNLEVVPISAIERPSVEFISWHNENRFLG